MEEVILSLPHPLKLKDRGTTLSLVRRETNLEEDIGFVKITTREKMNIN